MLSVERARQILGADCSLNDSEIMTLLIQLEGIAIIALDAASLALPSTELIGEGTDV